MPTPFPHYVDVKDKYCCCYLGNSPEYILSLCLLKPQIEDQLPGLRFWIGCPDEFEYVIKNEDQVILLSELEKRKNEFHCIRKIRNNMLNHSVLELMKESELVIKPIVNTTRNSNNRTCLICPEGIEPTKSLKESDINQITVRVVKAGYTPLVIGSDIHHSVKNIQLRPSGDTKIQYVKMAGRIIGVENEYLFQGALNGIDTTLIETGVGKNLFKSMFPSTKSVQNCNKISL